MEKMISNIVFTKNRPMQLDAYLQSLYRYFPLGLIRTYIIYKVELFDEEYQQLFRKYADCIVIKENDFHSDFLQTLGQVSTKYILFGVDDVVYFDSIDFEVIDETFNEFSDDIFGFSLRFNEENVKKSDSVSKTVIAGQTVYNLNWTQGRASIARYPFELCATVYTTALVKKIINSAMNNNPLVRKLFSPSSALVGSLAKVASGHSILKSFGYFYNPNTLESWNCRWCQNHSEQLPAFLYFQKHCASAIQVNVVNVSGKTQFSCPDEYAVEALAERYRQGYRLDIDFVSQNKPIDTHSDKQYFRLVKKF